MSSKIFSILLIFTPSLDTKDFMNFLFCLPIDPRFGTIFCTHLFLPNGRVLEGHLSSLERLSESGSLPVSGGSGFLKKQWVSDTW